MSPKNQIRVLMADDHALLLEGFGSVMTRFGISIERLISKPEEVISVYSETRPQVIVLDIRFGKEMSGIELAKKLLQKHPDANIVFLSQYDQGTLIREAYRLGARAFLNKSSPPQMVADAVIAASKGEKFYSPEVDLKFRELVVEGGRSPQELLNERHMNIFIDLANGHSLTDIAGKLGLSIKTISVEAKEIKKLLSAENDSVLTRLAIKHGLIDLD